MTESRLEKMPIWQLRDIAHQEHPEHDEAAARVFVARILDMEAQRRTLYRDEHLQGNGASQIAPGYAPGGTDIAREPLATMYDRGIRYHEGHEAARRWIDSACLSPRQLLAALIQARKLHGNGDQAGAGKDWVKSYEQIADDIGHYAQLLGFGSVLPVLPETETRIVERQVRREVKGRHETEIMPRVRKEKVEVVKPLFKNGQAIKDAAQSARAELIAQVKAGVV